MSLLALILALSVAGDGRESSKPSDELSRLQGEWIVIAYYVGEQKPAGGRSAPVRFSIEGDKMFTTLRNGRRYTKGSKIKLDTSKSPHWIDLEADDHRFVGIYDLDGKHLRICYHQKTRPTKFDPCEKKEEPYSVLFELER